MPRIRMYEWTEGSNPTLVESAKLTAMKIATLNPNRCAFCSGPLPPGGGFVAELNGTPVRYCARSCMKLSKAAALNRFNAKPKAHVVGIDLSLRAAAACALPFPWDHDLGKVRMLKAGYALNQQSTAKEKAQRIAQLAHDISLFCLNVKARRIGIEDYAYSASSAHQHQTFECGGVVKDRVLELLDLEVHAITAAAARKTLLGVVPRLGRGQTKPWVIRNVKRLGGPTAEWTDDECDAFVVANRVLADAGAVALAFDGE